MFIALGVKIVHQRLCCLSCALHQSVFDTEGVQSLMHQIVCAPQVSEAKRRTFTPQVYKVQRLAKLKDNVKGDLCCQICDLKGGVAMHLRCKEDAQQVHCKRQKGCAHTSSELST
jgi:hypothetical protein